MIVVANPNKKKNEEKEQNKYEMEVHPIITSIIERKAFENIKGEVIFKKFYSKLCGENPDILFYPSSFADTGDLIYFDNRKLPELEKDTPSIYIHSDLGKNNLMNDVRQRLKESNQFRIKETELFNSQGKEVSLFELLVKKSRRTKWLLQFTGTPNEELLKLFINKGISIKYIYSVCDGITHGMGGDDELENISTIYYPYFYKILNTKYHITEFHSDNYYKKIEKAWYDKQKKNLINFSNHLNSKEKRISILRNTEILIGDFVSKFKAKKINKPTERFLGGNGRQENMTLIIPNY